MSANTVRARPLPERPHAVCQGLALRAARLDEIRPGSRVDICLSIEADLFSARRGYSPWGATIRDVRPAASAAS